MWVVIVRFARVRLGPTHTSLIRVRSGQEDNKVRGSVGYSVNKKVAEDIRTGQFSSKG